LALHAPPYDWQFRSACTPNQSTERPAGTVLDSGTDTCQNNAASTPTTTSSTSPATTATTTLATTPPPAGPAQSRSGYWMVGSDGKVYAFGDAKARGDAPVAAGADATDLEPTPSGAGYWIVDSRGGVSPFG